MTACPTWVIVMIPLLCHANWRMPSSMAFWRGSTASPSRGIVLAILQSSVILAFSRLRKHSLASTSLMGPQLPASVAPFGPPGLSVTLARRIVKTSSMLCRDVDVIDLSMFAIFTHDSSQFSRKVCRKTSVCSCVFSLSAYADSGSEWISMSR